MHVLATVGHKVSNYRKYGILRAAEEVVRAGVLSYAPGSESVHMFHLSHFHRLVSFCWFGFGCWGGFVCFAVAFFLFADQSVRSSYQPMTSLAYLHDCHSRYDERSNVQKKKRPATPAASANEVASILGRPSLSPRRPIHKMAKAARWISLERHGGESPMSSCRNCPTAGSMAAEPSVRSCRSFQANESLGQSRYRITILVHKWSQ